MSTKSNVRGCNLCINYLNGPKIVKVSMKLSVTILYLHKNWDICLLHRTCIILLQELAMPTPGILTIFILNNMGPNLVESVIISSLTLCKNVVILSVP